MSKQKLLYGLIALLFAGGLLFWLLKPKSASFYRHIPDNSEFVAFVDGQELVMILLKEAVSNPQIWESIGSQLQKLGLKKGEFDPSGSTGIAMLSKHAAFSWTDSKTQSNCLGAYITLSDEADFRNFIDSTFNSKQTLDVKQGPEYQYMVSPKSQTGIAWNKDFALILRNPYENILKPELIRLMELESQSSLLKRSQSFAELIASEYDLAIWANNAKIPASFTEFSSRFLFQNGQVQILTNGYSNQAESDKNPLTQSPQQGFSFPKAKINGHTAMTPEMIHYLFQPFLNSNSEAKDVMVAFIDCWDGVSGLRITGSREVEQLYTSYDYDDDFNKIEVISRRKVQVPDLDIVFQGKSIDHAKNFVQDWKKRGLLIEHEGFFALVQLIDFPVYLKQDDKHILFSTDSTRIHQLLELVEPIPGEADLATFNMDANIYQLFPPALKENPTIKDQMQALPLVLESINGTISSFEDHYTSGEIRLQFQNKEVNALVEIIRTIVLGKGQWGVES